MKRMLASLAVAIGGLGGVLAGREFAPADATASVTVVHGIPDTTVTVFVNGKNILPDFKPGTVSGPLQLPTGQPPGEDRALDRVSVGAGVGTAGDFGSTTVVPAVSRCSQHCWRVASRLTPGTSQGVLFVLDAHNGTESADTAAIISGGPGAQYRRFTRARRGDWHAAVATFRPGSEPTLLNAGLRRRGVAGDS